MDTTNKKNPEKKKLPWFAQLLIAGILLALTAGVCVLTLTLCVRMIRHEVQDWKASAPQRAAAWAKEKEDWAKLKLGMKAEYAEFMALPPKERTAVVVIFSVAATLATLGVWQFHKLKKSNRPLRPLVMKVLKTAGYSVAAGVAGVGLALLKVEAGAIIACLAAAMFHICFVVLMFLWLLHGERKIDQRFERRKLNMALAEAKLP